MDVDHKVQTIKKSSTKIRLDYTSAKQNHNATSTVYTLPYKKQQMKYMHQTFFNLLATTLIKATVNTQLINITFMKAELIRKYLPPSPDTPKGGMKRPRTGIRIKQRMSSKGCYTLAHLRG